MDPLAHVFLPLLVAYVLVPELVSDPRYLLVGVAGLLADVDKLLGAPGLFHSLVTMLPIGMGFIVLDRRYLDTRGRVTLAVVIAWSHLLLDVVDGGPVPLLAPLVEVGVGLTYPMQVTFGEGLLGMTFQGALVAVRTDAPRAGFNTYGFVNAYGVATLLVFLVAYVGCHYRDERDW